MVGITRRKIICPCYSVLAFAAFAAFAFATFAASWLSHAFATRSAFSIRLPAVRYSLAVSDTLETSAASLLLHGGLGRSSDSGIKRLHFSSNRDSCTMTVC